MNNTLYREIILEHFRNPQNFGEILDADFTIDEDNPLCGDQIHLTGIIEKGKIANINFTSNGCVISKASASILTEYSKDKSVKELQNLTQQDVLTLLDIPLTAARLKCALLIFSALQKACINYNTSRSKYI